MQHAALTDVGMRRSNNQDSHTVVLASDADGWFSRGHLFMVADGMGAHAAGELASKLAVDGVPHLYLKHPELSPPESLEKAIIDTNAEVHRRGEANEEFHAMGTTCSALVLLPQGAIAGHIGDSRIYRRRGEYLQQLTFDHSIVWEMRAAGQIPAGGDVPSMIPKNVITRSLGPHAEVQVDLEGPFPIELGDTFLLCSDGLTGKVEDHEIGPILAELPPDEAAQVLCDLANLRGGPDNITVIVVRVTGPQITTNLQAEPLTVGASRTEKKGAHPAVWIVTGVCLLAALGMAVMGSAIPALMAGLGGVVALAVGLLQQFGASDRGGVQLIGERRLGKGPHTATHCPVNAEFVAQLAGTVEELRDAIEQRTTLQLDEVEPLRQAALAEAQAKNLRQALRHNTQAIQWMMGQLRTLRRKNAAET